MIAFFFFRFTSTFKCLTSFSVFHFSLFSLAGRGGRGERGDDSNTADTSWKCPRLWEVIGMRCFAPTAFSFRCLWSLSELSQGARHRQTSVGKRAAIRGSFLSCCRRETRGWRGGEGRAATVVRVSLVFKYLAVISVFPILSGFHSDWLIDSSDG